MFKKYKLHHYQNCPKVVVNDKCNNAIDQFINQCFEDTAAMEPLYFGKYAPFDIV